MASTKVKTNSGKSSKSGQKSKTTKPAIGKNGPNLAYLREMAKDLGMSGYSRMNKTDLIHSIQLAEGNSDCYSRIVNCGETQCLFYVLCQEVYV